MKTIRPHLDGLFTEGKKSMELNPVRWTFPGTTAAPPRSPTKAWSNRSPSRLQIEIVCLVVRDSGIAAPYLCPWSCPTAFVTSFWSRAH